MLLPPRKDESTMFTHCDGEYLLRAVDLKGNLPVLSIEGNNVLAKAYFFERVPKEVKERILNAVDRSIEQGQPVTMPLQIDCYFSGNKRLYCVIVGAGAPREKMHHYKLADIPDDVKGKDRLLPGLD